MTPVMAVVTGVALGAAFGDLSRVHRLCCRKHRKLYIMAVVSADVLLNTPEPA